MKLYLITLSIIGFKVVIFACIRFLVFVCDIYKSTLSKTLNFRDVMCLQF